MRTFEENLRSGLSPHFGHSTRSKSTRLIRADLLLTRGASDLRNIAVRTSPVVTVAPIDPDVYHEILLSLGRSTLLVRLGLDETDYCNLRAKVTYRQLPRRIEPFCQKPPRTILPEE